MREKPTYFDAVRPDSSVVEPDMDLGRWYTLPIQDRRELPGLGQRETNLLYPPLLVMPRVPAVNQIVEIDYNGELKPRDFHTAKGLSNFSISSSVFDTLNYVRGARPYRFQEWTHGNIRFPGTDYVLGNTPQGLKAVFCYDCIAEVRQLISRDAGRIKDPSLETTLSNIMAWVMSNVHISDEQPDNISGLEYETVITLLVANTLGFGTRIMTGCQYIPRAIPGEPEPEGAEELIAELEKERRTKRYDIENGPSFDDIFWDRGIGLYDGWDRHKAEWVEVYIHLPDNQGYWVAVPSIFCPTTYPDDLGSFSTFCPLPVFRGREESFKLRVNYSSNRLA